MAKLVLLALLTPSHALSLGTNRRALIQSTVSAATLAALPNGALAGTKDIARKRAENAVPAKCFDKNFAEVPCGGIVVESAGASVDTNKDDGKKLDPNNFIASDYKTFSGLYPTIGGKLYKRTQNYAFKSKQEMYDCLDTEQERAVLKAFDGAIVIRAQDREALSAKLATN